MEPVSFSTRHISTAFLCYLFVHLVWFFVINLKQNYNLKKETVYKWWPLKENIWKVNTKDNKVAHQTLKIDFSPRSPEFKF